jgi:hypothetical protein
MDRAAEKRPARFGAERSEAHPTDVDLSAGTPGRSGTEQPRAHAGRDAASPTGAKRREHRV